MRTRRNRYLILALTILMTGCLETEITTKVLDQPTTADSTGQAVQTLPTIEQVVVDEAPTPDQIETSPYITVNGGSPYTNQMNFTLEFHNNFAYQYRVSQNGSCGGEWLNMVPSVELQIQNENAKNLIHIQFRDPDFLESTCETVAIIHDTAAPVVTFSPVPPSQPEIGDVVDLGIRVTDMGIGVSEVLCRLNGQELPVRPQANGN